MKKLFIVAVLYLFVYNETEAQGFKGILNRIKQDSGKATLGKVISGVSVHGNDSLTNTDIIGGLKEALITGTERGLNKLSSADGFFRDAAIKILMPEEAKKAEQTLRNFGLGKQVDNAILSMNRAAEDASKSAVPIFVNAIKQMNIQDAMGILKGGDFAATNFLKSKTTAELTAAFRPVIGQSLNKVNATQYWNTVFTSYNKFSSNKVNPDLTAYVTEKALAGIFYQVGLEEQKIRKDPAARTTGLLKQVFGSKL